MFNPLDPPVFGFTDKECSNDDYKLFRNLAALIAADGKKDPNSEDPDKIWNYGSYIKYGDYTLTCHLLEYEEVVVIGVVPKKPTTGGGGGEEGGGEAPPQEPIPQKKKADKHRPTTLPKTKQMTYKNVGSQKQRVFRWRSKAGIPMLSEQQKLFGE
ncbi:MAG: hypothetical protein F4227_10645 [Gammaproteobacteria bacterium]|nr:hypothetical protein [Gammaproteobacteria bacterium]MYF03393.1 hypothetical protein [Gammaproteobacteria bacterium]MYI77103.1 hypothetical protein [Gammaproteobacteria bacterium]